METFRRIHLPYVVSRVDDHRYIVLNRIYKPLGISSRDWVDYGQEPKAAEMHGLTPSKVVALSIWGDSDIDDIYLYDDHSIPDSSEDAWNAYTMRLLILAKLQIRLKP